MGVGWPEPQGEEVGCHAGKMAQAQLWTVRVGVAATQLDVLVVFPREKCGSPERPEYWANTKRGCHGRQRLDFRSRSSVSREKWRQAELRAFSGAMGLPTASRETQTRSTELRCGGDSQQIAGGRAMWEGIRRSEHGGGLGGGIRLGNGEVEGAGVEDSETRRSRGK